MRSKQGLSGRISVRAERQALAALLSSSAHVTAYPVWLIDTSNQMSLRVLRGFPGERQPVSRLWLIILLPGAIRRHRWKTVGPHAQEETFPKFDACLPDDVLLPLSELQLLLFYRDAEKHQHYCTSLVNPRVVGSGYALWLQVGGQFGLRIAAEQLSKLWKGCHQLSCDTLSTTQMWSNISKRPCEAKKNAPPWNVIHARGVFSYWFLVQTGIQVGVSGIRKQKRWCGVKVCSDGAG